MVVRVSSLRTLGVFVGTVGAATVGWMGCGKVLSLPPGADVSVPDDGMTPRDAASEVSTDAGKDAASVLPDDDDDDSGTWVEVASNAGFEVAPGVTVDLDNPSTFS